jgi:hypothetical protein
MIRQSLKPINRKPGVSCGTCVWRSQRVVIEGLTRCCNPDHKRHYRRVRKNYDWCTSWEGATQMEAAE